MSLPCHWTYSWICSNLVNCITGNTRTLDYIADDVLHGWDKQTILLIFGEVVHIFKVTAWLTLKTSFVCTVSDEEFGGLSCWQVLLKNTLENAGLYRKLEFTGICIILHIFCSKHWLIEAALTSISNLYLELKRKETIISYHLKNAVSAAMKYCMILNRQ